MAGVQASDSNSLGLNLGLCSYNPWTNDTTVKTLFFCKIGVFNKCLYGTYF